MAARIAAAPPNAEGLGWTVGKPVVRLPTAQPRQVQQPGSKAGRMARAAYRAENPWRREYVHPGIRAHMDEAEALRTVTPSAELSLALAIFHSLPEEQQGLARGLLAIGAKESTIARAALALVKRRTVGEQVDFDAAVKMLGGSLTRIKRS